MTADEITGQEALRGVVQMAAERLSVEGQAKSSTIEATALRNKMDRVARELFATLAPSPPKDAGEVREANLRLEWAVGALRVVVGLAPDDIQAIAQAGLDLAEADETALADAGNEEALASLREARSISAPPQPAATEAEVRGAARVFLADMGWIPGDRIHTPGAVELLTSFAMQAGARLSPNEAAELGEVADLAPPQLAADRVREALEAAKREIVTLAETGTQKLRDAGMDVDDAERTYAPIIARIDALSALEAEDAKPVDLDAQSIADSDRVMRVFAAPEWVELHTDGQEWVRAIIAEVVARVGHSALEAEG